MMRRAPDSSFGVAARLTVRELDTPFAEVRRSKREVLDVQRLPGCEQALGDQQSCDRLLGGGWEHEAFERCKRVRVTDHRPEFVAVLRRKWLSKAAGAKRPPRLGRLERAR
jgi:hypothetical protein